MPGVREDCAACNPKGVVACEKSVSVTTFELKLLIELAGPSMRAGFVFPLSSPRVFLAFEAREAIVTWMSCQSADLGPARCGS